MAQTYTRQSTFADGDTITAALFNDEYNQLVNAFAYSSSSASSTGHRHDGTAGQGGNIHTIGDLDFLNKIVVDSTNNRWGFYVEVSSYAVEQLRLQDGALLPVTDSDVDLGTSSLYFKDAYIDSITTTGNVAVGGNLVVTGTTTFNGGTITMGDAATDNVVFGADVDSNIIPDDDDSYDLGSSSQEWRNLFIDGTANIDSLVADTADINGGTIDGAIIGGSSAADITGTAITGTSFVIGSADISEAELETIDGVTAGTVAASKAVVVDSNKDIGSFRNITLTGELDAGSLDVSGDVDVDGTLETDALSINGTAVTSTAAELNILDGVTSTAAELNILDGVTSTAAELNILDGVTATAAELNILDGVTATAAEINALDGITSTVAELNILDGVTASATDINLIDGITNGTVIASKAIITDANKDITGGRNITISGELDAATLDISGDADIDGTLEADAITIGGVTLAETISDTVGAMVTSNTETGVTVTYDDSDNTLDFVIGTLNQDTTGLAATATALATARTIHGVSFDGTANIDLSEVVQDTVGTMFSSNTETGITATYQDADGTIDLVVGTLNQDTTGNSATATALETARTIHGVSFDGTANIDLTEVVQDTVGAMVSSNTESGITVAYEDSDGTLDFTVGTLNQNTTGSAATLTTARTIGGVSFDGSANITPTTFTSATFSGDVNVDSGVLFVDVSENRIGVNQTSPDVSLDLGANTDSIHVPVGTTAQRPGSPAAGYFRYNSTTGGFEGYTDEWGAIAGGGGGTAPAIDTMTGDGSDTTLSLSAAPTNENATFVTLDGVLQHKDTYAVSGSTLTFSTAPPTGVKVECITLTTTSISTATTVQDADGDTKIQVEESSDEDTIRFDIGGSEKLVLNSTALTLTGDFAATGIAIKGSTTNFVGSMLISNDGGTGTLDAASNNTGFGHEVFDDLTSGDDNTAVGYQAGTKILAGHSNTLIGKSAGAAITSGAENVFVGERAGDAVTTGSNNTGIGHKALSAVETSSNNVGVGNDTLENCTTGSTNTALGDFALRAVTDSTNNVGVGYLAGSGITTGGRNTCLGEGSGIAGSPSGAITTSSNIMCLGDDNMQTLFCAQGTINTSDSRDKTDVNNFTGGLAWINKMNPVTYKWDRRSWYAGDEPESKDILAATPDGSKKSSKVEIGLIAQDVLDIEKDNGYGANNDNSLLVNLTEDETRYGINYTSIIPILINSIKELSATVTDLKTRIETLEGGE